MVQSARIAVDVASGDYGTPEMVRGVLEARRAWGDKFCSVLCGDEEAIRKALDEAGAHWPMDGVRIEHCPDTILSTDRPSRVWKRRQRSSIVRAIALQREGAVEATISAGDTGILLAAALFLLGRLGGISRPALAVSVPTTTGQPAILLDVGANVDCKAPHLLSFARMGCEYMRNLAGIGAPRVALLNVGVERSKGTRLISEAHRLITREFGACSYIEAGDLFSGQAHVIVCDGFTGNVLLKVCQGFYGITGALLADSPEILSVVRRKMAVLDAEAYGAVPFLGIRGVVLKAHGNSSARAIASAIGTTLTVLQRGALPVGSQKGHWRFHV